MTKEIDATLKRVVVEYVPARFSALLTIQPRHLVRRDRLNDLDPG